jgi:putative transposase
VSNLTDLRKAYKYKLKPTPEQERQLEQTVWRCRVLYNTALEQRKTAYERCGVTLSAYHQQAELPDLKAAFPEYAEIHSQVLQDVLTRLDRAIQAFFRRLKRGEKPGCPRFQGRNRYHSFTYKQHGNGAQLDNGFLVLSKIGRLAIRWSRPLEGTPKTVTITQEADGWYATISCAEVPAQPLLPTGQETGIDVGLKVFLVTAQGVVFENPRYLRKAERYIIKCQQRVSRRKKSSKRRRKTVALLAKSIGDAGWAQFRAILEAKAACAGRQVIAVNPAYTSQQCSGCDALVRKSLSVRTHVCPACGLVLDRDENAARNIQWAGQALREVAALATAMNRESSWL